MRQVLFVGRACPVVVRTRLRQAERAIRAATHVGDIVIVLPVILPEANGTDLVPASLVQGEASAAWAPRRPSATRTCATLCHHPPIVHRNRRIGDARGDVDPPRATRWTVVVTLGSLVVQAQG